VPLPLDYFFQKDKETPEPFIREIQIEFNEEIEVAVFPSPDRELVKGTEHEVAPEALEEPFITECQEGVDVYGIQEPRVLDPGISDLIVGKIFPALEVGRGLESVFKGLLI
jgi:hypothetical protein